MSSVNSYNHDDYLALESFLTLITNKLEKPKIKVNPVRINLRCYRGDKCSANIRITNPARGYLFGTIELSGSSSAYTLSEYRFGLHGKNNDTLTVELTIETSLLANNSRFQNEIIISSNATQENIRIPVEIEIITPSPVIAAFLSYFTGGGGQLYLGQTSRGIVFTALHFTGLIYYLIIFYSTSNSSNGSSLTAIIMIAHYWYLHVHSSLEAYVNAREISQGNRTYQTSGFGCASYIVASLIDGLIIFFITLMANSLF